MINIQFEKEDFSEDSKLVSQYLIVNDEIQIIVKQMKNKQLLSKRKPSNQ